jgi:4-amino-4-deoxy-L-arabinose transferase-like glycosyltransferase
VWAVPPLAFFLYFFRLTAAGMLGPDEPRYAAIGREMARSGDWITPRLWGHPWFEKPALLYWMTGLASRLGLGPDLAPRLPVAIVTVGFLAFFWWILRREFGSRAAWLATAILGTSAEWIGFAQVGATDLPMAAASSAAMLLALPWVATGDRRWLPWVGALAGAAVLAKGLVPLGLSLPLVWPAWKYRRGLGRALGLAGLPFAAVALPWYVICYLKNGSIFLTNFFWIHHFERLTSDALLHVQPWWFYAPVFVAALLPWSPLLAIAVKRPAWADPRRLFLLLVVLWGLALFTLARNKLPGYVLPLVPAMAALMGIALDRASRTAAWLGLCALQLVWFPIAGPILPAVVATGLSRAPAPRFSWTWLLPLAMAAAVWFLARRGRRSAATFVLAAGVTAGVVYLKIMIVPEVDLRASARPLAAQIAGRAQQVCLESLQRNWEYGLDYYLGSPLPSCADAPRPLHVVQEPGYPPRLRPAATLPPG